MFAVVLLSCIPVVIIHRLRMYTVLCPMCKYTVLCPTFIVYIQEYL